MLGWRCWQGSGQPVDASTVVGPTGAKHSIDGVQQFPGHGWNGMRAANSRRWNQLIAQRRKAARFIHSQKTPRSSSAFLRNGAASHCGRGRRFQEIPPAQVSVPAHSNYFRVSPAGQWMKLHEGWRGAPAVVTNSNCRKRGRSEGKIRRERRSRLLRTDVRRACVASQ
jgi:hypothetical protein